MQNLQLHQGAGIKKKCFVISWLQQEKCSHSSPSLEKEQWKKMEQGRLDHQ